MKLAKYERMVSLAVLERTAVFAALAQLRSASDAWNEAEDHRGPEPCRDHEDMDLLDAVDGVLAAVFGEPRNWRTKPACDCLHPLNGDEYAPMHEETCPAKRRAL